MGVNEPKAAIFDLDGTLVLSEQRNREVWSRFFAAHGLDDHDELMGYVIGRRGIDALADLAHKFPGRDPEDLITDVWGWLAATTCRRWSPPRARSATSTGCTGPG